MIGNKKVSIIVCFYNEEKYLSKAIDSVLTQSYSNFELILVNDGSTDHSDEIVKSYHDDRIIYISYEGNKHQAYARNRGLEKATGDYIGFFDGDDIMMPDKIEKQVKYLEEHKDILLVSGGYVYMDEKGKTDDKVNWPQYWSNKQIRAFMLYRNCVAFAGAALFRRAVIDQHHVCFDETNRASEDYCFFIDMLPWGNFVNIKECFFYYRVNYGSKSSTVVKENENAYDKEIEKVLYHAWSMRGFLLEEEDISFMHDFFYKCVGIWKPKDVLRGMHIYKKIKRQLYELKLDEDKLILKYYRKQWLNTYYGYRVVKDILSKWVIKNERA